MDSPDSGRVGGVAMEFPFSDDSTLSHPRVPPRLRRRLFECKTSPATVEEIEAKLRDADLRRQKFYENLSNKARTKPRSPPPSSPNEEDLGLRLEAKLQAAEQKRLSMLAKAQMRLARLDELRQAAKTGVEMRFKKEQEELGSKVESRVQQAEANRMLILKAYKQRRASVKERTSQSLLRRMARENKYKERVCATMSQKRLAAENKRLGLLEAEKRRACARTLQVRKVAKSVSHMREIERRKMKDNLEDRLQRAKRQRAEYLRQRGRLHNSIGVNWNATMQKRADLLSRKLARCWRRFLSMNKTTFDLAKAYDDIHINESSVKSMPFEQLAVLIESPATLQAVKALLDRLECRYKLSKASSASGGPSSWNDIDHLLKRVASPKRRRTPRKSTPRKQTKTSGSPKEVEAHVKLSRYQVRVVLCAYMILGHPDAVFSGRGERESSLVKSARKFIQEFELLIKMILDGPTKRPKETEDPAHPNLTVRSQLAAFDAAWCSYLNSFVAWKVKDAESLEEDLVRAACQLELSMMQTCKMTPNGDGVILTHDMKAVQKQVTEDQKLLREKVHHLGGAAGIERMESAISNTRTKYFEAKENGSSSVSPVHIPSPNLPIPSAGSSLAATDGEKKTSEVNQGPRTVVRSLFQDGSSNSSGILGSELLNGGDKLVMEKELILNEVLHEQQLTFVDNLKVPVKDEDIMEAKIKETLEKAFWDGIIDSMKQKEPNYDQVVQLMREVRDELCEMAPQSWKEEINQAIDVEILTQVLSSGQIDMNYLGKILEFALTTLQRLSAPANEDELKVAHLTVLKELGEICESEDGSSSSHSVALIKGLRFVLEQIQALKHEISKARIKIMEPLLKGPAGLEYLRNTFSTRYGSPTDAVTALPLTMGWISSVWNTVDQEWNEHRNACLAVSQGTYSQRLLPSTALKTGRMSSGSQLTSLPAAGRNTTDVKECNGQRVDLVTRIGLLKLVSGISGLTEEALPETMKLNFMRLRSAQAQFQKIIAICTSILVLRQTLVSEKLVSSPAEIESTTSSCVQRLFQLLDTDETAGLKEIVGILGSFTGGDKSGYTEKLESRKVVMARFLSKSLQAGDPIFVRVSRAVYLAYRAVVLGGSGQVGREVAEAALRQVGAVPLLDKVVESAAVVVVAATVSGGVHGPWYARLMENM